jgi:histidinol-phosphate aminotransferase
MTDPILHTPEEERVVHGAFDYGELARLGLHPSEILDFSVNCNPYGSSPAAREAIAQVAIERYPDRECWQLRQAVLEHELAGLDLPFSSIVCGNGTSELIWTVARIFLAPGTKAVIVAPTFGEYRAASLAAGAAIIELPAEEERQFQPDLTALRFRIVQEKPGIVWLCNPNNPTGVWMEYEQLFLLANTCHSAGALLVIDESYWRFVTPPATYTALNLMQEHSGLSLLVLRSLTKDFALASLRLGYAVSSPKLIRRVRAQLPSWNVSGLAQAAGVAALRDRVHLHTTLAALTCQRQAFFAALQEAGLHMLPSRTHFCLLDVGDARFVRQELLMQRLLVRDCTSFGLSRCIRVATRSAHEWGQLLQALREVVKS